MSPKTNKEVVMTTTNPNGMNPFTEDITRCIEGLRIARLIILFVALCLGLPSLLT